MNPLRTAFIAALAASLPSLAMAQCAVSWHTPDPAPFARGVLGALGTWDPDGTGPLGTRLLVGTGAQNSLHGGPHRQVGLLAFDGLDWTAVATPADVIAVTAVGLVQGQTAVATAHSLTLPGQPTLYYTTISILTPGGHTVVVDYVRGSVHAIAEFAGELVFAGDFTEIGLFPIVPCSRIARLTAGGTLATLGTGIDGTVFSIANYQGRLYAGGSFGTAGGATAANLAAWNGSAWAPVGNPNGTVLDLAVRNATAVTNTHLFAAGDFTAIGPLAAVGVARYNAANNAWVAFSTATRPCESLVVRGVGLTGFELTATHGDHRAYRWVSGAWVSIDPSGPNQVDKRELQFWNGVLVARERGPSIDQRVRAYDGSSWPPLAGRGIAGAVRAVLPLGADYVIGGDFATVSGVPMNGIARGAPGVWQPLGSGLGGGSVLALARLPNGEIVAGGSFTLADGAAAQGLARWNGTSWQAFGSGNGVVRALHVLPDGNLVVGGDFTVMGGVAANGVARWNGASWSAFGSGLSGGAASVQCFLRRDNGELLVGGDFTNAGGVTSKNVAGWTGSGWIGYGTSLVAPVTELEQLPTGELLAWRNLPGSGTCFDCRADLWNGFLWSAVPTGNANLSNTAAGALLPNGGVVSASTMTNAVARANYRATPPNGSTAAWTTMPMVGRAVYGVVTATNGDVVVHGDFDAVGPVGLFATIGSGNLAVLRPGCPAAADTVGAGCPGTTGTVAFTATTLPWLGGSYRATATGFAPGALAVETVGVQAANLSLAPLAAIGCTLHLVPDVLYAFAPSNGAVSVQLAIPATAALLGITLRDQFLQLEFAPNGELGTVSASNALGLVLGSY